MSTPADRFDPTEAHPGIPLREAASQVEGLLDDDGHVTDGEPSRALRDAEDQTGDDPSRQVEGQDAPDDETDDTQNLDDDATDDSDSADAEDAETADTETETPESDGDADDSDADTDDSPIETLTQLAEALELPVDDLKSSIEHTFNAAGEEVTVTLAELESGYQRDADYRRSTAKLAEGRRALETDTEERLNLFNKSHHVTSNVIAAAMQILTADLEAPAMQELRNSDPAEWSARRQEILQRAQMLDNARQQAAANYDETLNDTRKKVREANIADLEGTGTWNEEAKTEVRAIYESLGFTDDEIKGVMDARTVKGLLELSSLRKEVTQLRERIATAEANAKRTPLRKPKRQVKPGQGATGKGGDKPGNVSKDRVAKLNRRLGQTHRVEDAAKVIEHTILTG